MRIIAASAASIDAAFTSARRSRCPSAAWCTHSYRSGQWLNACRCMVLVRVRGLVEARVPGEPWPAARGG